MIEAPYCLGSVANGRQEPCLLERVVDSHVAGAVRRACALKRVEVRAERAEVPARKRLLHQHEAIAGAFRLRQRTSRVAWRRKAERTRNDVVPDSLAPRRLDIRLDRAFNPRD